MITAQIVRGTNGVIASGHHLASFEGASVLRNGGNAVYAALASAAVLSVVAPHACGLGGDAFILVFDAASQRVYLANGSGAAAALATPDRYSEGIPDDGPLSVTVPGALAAWSVVCDRFGTRPLTSLMAAAVKYAEEGFAAYDYLVSNIKNTAPRLRKYNAKPHPFLPSDRLPQPGDIIRQPELAKTLRHICGNGPCELYRLETAGKLVACVEKLGGLLAGSDLARHETLWQEPIVGSFRGYDIVTAPPNSWGLALLMMLRSIEDSDAASADGTLSSRLLGEVRAWKTSLSVAEGLVAESTATEASGRQTIDRRTRPGRRAPDTGQHARGYSAGTDTSCVCVMDKRGNAVSLIQSVSSPFGSGIVAAETGIVLNNRMRGFNTDQSHPNCVGAHKRPAHTLVPVLALRDGRPAIAIATPGAAGQVCTLAQVLSRTLGLEERLDSAISAARWSVGQRGDIIAENSLDQVVLDELAGLGEPIKVAEAGSFTFGSVKAVGRSREGFIGVADQRRCAAACAW